MEEEINLEDLTDSTTFTYIKTFLEEAVLDSSVPVIKGAINNLRNIGEHILGNPEIIGGFERYKKLYLIIANQNGTTQETYVSPVPEKYQDASSHNFTLNGASNATIKLKYI